MTTTVVQLQRSNDRLREINRGLVFAYLRADLAHRARREILLYDQNGVFEIALDDMPNDAVLQEFYRSTDVRYFSRGIV